MKKQSNIKKWSVDMFEYMKGKNKLHLTVDDMKAVRELAVRRFGYMMFVFSEVAEAYKEVTAKN